MKKLDIKQTVDELGRVKAEIAELQKQEKNLVAALKKKGFGVYSGELFDANVFEQNRTQTNWEGLAESLGYTFRQLKKFQEVKPIVCCKVTARKERDNGK